MSVKLLTKHHLVFLSLKGGCTGSSESTHVKMPHCWKSRAKACVSFSSDDNKENNGSSSNTDGKYVYSLHAG